MSLIIILFLLFDNDGLDFQKVVTAATKDITAGTRDITRIRDITGTSRATIKGITTDGFEDKLYSNE